jgi:hypothetical protein
MYFADEVRDFGEIDWGETATIREAGPRNSSTH